MTVDAVALLPTVTLDELNAEAGLLTRVDRKYVIPADDLDAVVTGVAGLRALAIDGHLSSRYESTYLDTLDLDSWASSAHPRRRRWKVRTRVYADTGSCWLEVKTRGARGVTVKERLAHLRRRPARGGCRCRLVGGRAARRGRGPRHRPRRPGADASHQLPTYDVAAGRGCRAGDHRPRPDLDLRPRHGRVGPVLVVETKSSSAAPGPFDRKLWELGHRPVRISKYGTGLALLTPDLPRNRWHRVTSRHLAEHLTLREGALARPRTLSRAGLS